MTLRFSVAKSGPVPKPPPRNKVLNQKVCGDDGHTYRVAYRLNGRVLCVVRQVSKGGRTIEGRPLQVDGPKARSLIQRAATAACRLLHLPDPENAEDRLRFWPGVRS